MDRLTGCKLVRDKLARDLLKRGIPIRRAREPELDPLLRAKVVEEALELAERPGPEEAGDLLEAVRELLRIHGYSLEDALVAMEKKRSERGGFREAFVLCLPSTSPEGRVGDEARGGEDNA